MFGILASAFRNATRTEPFPETEFEREARIRDRRAEDRRREREALDREIRYRRGYW